MIGLAPKQSELLRYFDGYAPCPSKSASPRLGALIRLCALAFAACVWLGGAALILEA